MAATTRDRNSPALLIERELSPVVPAAGQVIPAGVMVCLNAAGAAVNASDTAALKMWGRSGHRCDQTAGDDELVCERGVFLFANDGNVTAAMKGSPCYVLDNQTVTNAATATNDIVAGIVEEVTSAGVAVAMLGGVVAAT